MSLRPPGHEPACFTLFEMVLYDHSALWTRDLGRFNSLVWTYRVVV